MRISVAGTCFLLFIAPVLAAPPGEQPASQPVAPAAALSDAEKISRLQRSIEQSKARLQMLRADLEDPQSEYDLASAAFQTIDKELDDLNRRIARLEESGEADEAAQLSSQRTELQTRWNIAKERFDLAIQGRKTAQEEISTLESKVREERAALDRLRGVKPTDTQPSASPAPAPPTVDTNAPSDQPQVTPTNTSLGPAGVPIPTPPSPATSQPAARVEEPAKSAVVRRAEAKAEEKKAAAEEAAVEAKSISEVIKAVQKAIDLKRDQLETLRRRADNAQSALEVLKSDLDRKQAAGAPAPEIAALRKEIAAAEERAAAIRLDGRTAYDDLSELQSALATLQSEQIFALEEAEARRIEAERAQKTVERLQNPFAPRNVLQWVIDRGPKLAFIVAGMFGVLWLGRMVEGRIISLMTIKPGRGSFDERKNRAQTLVGAFRYAATVAVVVGGILMILQEIGVSVAPLLGGAAVVGLAVAFGAQNLIRDYFTGFLILMENQYGINDVIRIGETSGTVERITLRTTVLRDLEGIVHFIPNGEIKQVSNLTHGWSRAVFEIGVAYKEDVDRVMKVLIEIGEHLREDEKFASKIIDQPTMLGVDSFGDSAIVIKFFMKTRPLQQWEVKREMLRRIKMRFDELGIEIPFPHRTVFHRSEDGPPTLDGRELAGLRSARDD